MHSDNPHKHTTPTLISVRCYAELNDFIRESRRQKAFILSLKTSLTVAEVIELLGIPLAEVDLVLVNSEPAERRYRVRNGDRMSLYPAFEVLDIGSLKTIQQEPLRETRFIVDAHLGKLARYLRMLGFDTLYRNDFEDQEIIRIAREEHRIILTRDKLLLKAPLVTHGYYVRTTNKHEQLIEVVHKFDLYSRFRSFTRCMTCNTPLEPKSREEIRSLVGAETLQCFREFYYCPACQKVFWKGSHFERMEKMILSIITRHS